MDGGYGQLAPKVFNLYATEIKTKELKIHAEELLAREGYNFTILPSRFYPSKFDPGILLIQGVVTGRALLFRCLIASSKYVRLCGGEYLL